jgi:phosphate transport system substrate-binding protein
MILPLSAHRLRFLGLAAVLALAVGACGGSETSTAPADTEATSDTSAPSDQEGGTEIKVDGSSTVFPISEAMAEEFMAANSGTKVTVGVAGTGGGFKRFCAGETDISNASRPIKPEEAEICAQAGIEFMEVPLAYDGLSVVVHPSNTWAACLTPEELGKTWAPSAEGKVTNWNQINPAFPDKPLALYGAGTDSGTYDYFMEATVESIGDEEGSRGDFTASEDDNAIVQGVTSDDGGMGFFGFAYYEENKDSLKIVQIKNAAGTCVEPTPETIASGEYNPLSRPVFFYVKKSAYEGNEAVKAFVDYQLSAEANPLISEVGYIPLPEPLMEKVRARTTAMTVGTLFEDGSDLGVKLEDEL